MCGRAGFDQGLGDGIGGRGRLLPSQQRDGVGSERRERPSLDPPARTDHAPQRPRHQEPLRDTVREGHHIRIDAGESRYIPVSTESTAS